MSVHDAELGDIYIDKQQKLWRVTAICREPTLTMEEVEGRAPPNPQHQQWIVGQVGAQAQVGTFPSIELIRSRINGGVGGAMWEGFKRIWRKGA